MVKALVVEDEEDIRNLLVEQLLDKGCQVRKADNGAIALQRVKEEIPDIIFVDIVMPVMDGILFVSELRKTQTPPPYLWSWCQPSTSPG